MSNRHIPRVYIAAPLESGKRLCLDEGSAHHLSRVLRMQVGDPLIAFNGQAGEFKARIHSISKAETWIEVDEYCAIERESPLRITLLQAVIRAERMDLSIGKAVELGVTAIQPLMLTRSQGMKAVQLQRKERHWQSVAQSAAEQSGRTQVPQINSCCDLAAWLANGSKYDQYLVLHPGLPGIKNQTTEPGSIALLIGPEGGLTDNEVRLVQQAGFAGLSLGPRILRSETAAMAAITACQLRWGDM